MPDPVTQRLYDVLRNDAVLTAQLATYQGLPAVFTTDPVPEGATFPYVWVRGPSQNFRSDCLNQTMRTVSRDIVSFTEETGDPTAVDNIAWRVREIFDDPHGRGLVGTLGGMADPGGGNWYPIILDASGPNEANSDADTYGRSVDITVTIERI